MGDRTGRRLAETVEEQPLLLGAFGLAIGAAIGALLPSSTAEDRLMGESRDRVADRLSAMAGEAYDKAKETAGEHLGDAQERVRGGAQALGEVARDLRETVERTAQDVGSAARAEIDQAEKDGSERRGEKPAASGTGTATTPGTDKTATPGTGVGTGTGNPPGRTTGTSTGPSGGPRIGPV
jgi:predicted RNA-binding Zn ribbon-like protein